jgi:hypothetical protein
MNTKQKKEPFAKPISYWLNYICYFLFADAEQRGGHQSHHQEEPGQVTEPARQRNQNIKGNKYSKDITTIKYPR